MEWVISRDGVGVRASPSTFDCDNDDGNCLAVFSLKILSPTGWAPTGYLESPSQVGRVVASYPAHA